MGRWGDGEVVVEGVFRERLSTAVATAHPIAKNEE